MPRTAVPAKPRGLALILGWRRVRFTLALSFALSLFGAVVIKSGFFPRILGIFLMIAGFAYITSSVTAILLPEYRAVVSRFMMPLYFGEVPIIFWLIKGGKSREVHAG